MSLPSIVISANRRYLIIKTGEEFQEFKVLRKYSNLISGDEVELEGSKIIAVKERKNLLKRSYYSKTKEIVANLDELMIVSAPPPLLNTTVMDRLLCVCELSNIKASLVFNKSDLDYKEVENLLEYYSNNGITTVSIVALEGQDLAPLIKLFSNYSSAKIAFAGVSGVGKSTILNNLLDNFQIRTSEVSNKTGQGRQTTSEVIGYVYDKNPNIILYDLPGIQNFGISHLDKYELREGFVDFKRNCAYKDCLHMKEPDCAVKKALEEKEIIPSRYESYLNMMSEIEKVREY